MKTVLFKHEDQRLEGTVTEDNHVKTESVGPFPLEDVDLLPPCRPSKIVGAARNYYADDRERAEGDRPDNPLIFFKPPSSLIPTGSEITIPESSEIICEAELGVVIDKECRFVDESEALDYVRGYTCVNDITATDWSGKENYGVRTKGMDTFCPTGPYLETNIDNSNPELDVRMDINGEVVADSNTEMMIFSVSELISHISQYMTLEPGDLIASGAPPQTRSLSPDDHVEITVEGVGRLENTVAKPKVTTVPGDD